MKILASLIKTFLVGLVFSLGFLSGTLLYAITLDLVTFNSGDLIKAADFNTNFKNIKTALTTLETQISSAELPAGSIIGWDRDLNYPAQLTLPSTSPFVPCDGRVINDATSIYNGKSIPLLNATGWSGSLLIGGIESGFINNTSVGSGLTTLNTFSVIWLCKIK